MSVGAQASNTGAEGQFTFLYRFALCFPATKPIRIARERRLDSGNEAYSEL